MCIIRLAAGPSSVSEMKGSRSGADAADVLMLDDGWLAPGHGLYRWPHSCSTRPCSDTMTQSLDDD